MSRFTYKGQFPSAQANNMLRAGYQGEAPTYHGHLRPKKSTLAAQFIS